MCFKALATLPFRGGITISLKTNRIINKMCRVSDCETITTLTVALHGSYCYARSRGVITGCDVIRVDVSRYSTAHHSSALMNQVRFLSLT